MEIDIKSPIFTPQPGWGGKLKKWLLRHLWSKILPIIAICTLIFGIYLVFSK